MTEVPSGLSNRPTELVAQQTNRCGKTVYIVSLPIDLVSQHLSVPDPEQPVEDNRQVSKAHAIEFGEYWRKNPDSWTVPPILVDCSDSLVFNEKYPILEGYRLGLVEIPRYSQEILRTLDGQHRIYGWDYITKKIYKEFDLAKDALLVSQNSGTDIEKGLAKKKLEEVKYDIERLNKEHVTLEIITNITLAEHKTFFVTIASKAKGVNQTEQTALDEINMSSRVARLMAENTSLFLNRVERRKNKASAQSKDIMSLSNLRDVVSNVCFGIAGRVTAGRERDFTDTNANAMAEHFIEAMLESSTALNSVIDGSYLPKELRNDSLLGSITIWKCLAGAYHELAVTIDKNVFRWNEEGHKKFVEMARSAINQMEINEWDGSRTVNEHWYETQCFNPGEASARSRSQDLKNLTALFVAWAKSGNVFQPPSISKS